MRTDITISLAPGTYRLTSPLALGPQDSGFNGHSVIWSGPAGKPAIVAGSRKIVGWRSMGGSLGIWRAAVPSGSNFRQLYVNGQRASLASGPVPVQLTETSTGYRASSSIMAKWRNPSDIDFVYTAQLGLMVEPICPVGSIHGATIQMAQPCWGNSNERTHNIVGFGILRQPSYVENAYELLRQPGQFYLDRTAHKLYYIPRPGQNMASADVEAPVLQALIAGSGSPSEPI